MKNLFIFVCVLGMILCVTSPLLAGNLEHKDAWSAEFVRTMSRNGSTDSADGAVYNPAGLVKMKDGRYVNFSIIQGRSNYWHTISGVDHKDDTPNVIPGLHMLYKKDKWAAFGSFTIVSGGGKAVYENGSATTLSIGQSYMAGVNTLLGASVYDTLNTQLDANEFSRAFTAGGAYAINDKVSVSLGARYIYALSKVKSRITIHASSGAAPDSTALLDYKATGDGICGIVGLNISPNEDLNIGMRYESETKIDLEKKIYQADIPGILTPGEKVSRNFPALYGLGISYQLDPNLRVETGFNYYFNRDAKWDDVALTTTRNESNGDNGFSAGMAFEYKIKPKWKCSLGYAYMDTGLDADDMTPEEPELNAHYISTGFAYEVKPDLNMNVGALRGFYIDKTTSSGMDLHKELYVFAVGMQYKFK